MSAPLLGPVFLEGKYRTQLWMMGTRGGKTWRVSELLQHWPGGVLAVVEDLPPLRTDRVLVVDGWEWVMASDPSVWSELFLSALLHGQHVVLTYRKVLVRPSEQTLTPLLLELMNSLQDAYELGSPATALVLDGVGHNLADLDVQAIFQCAQRRAGVCVSVWARYVSLLGRTCWPRGSYLEALGRLSWVNTSSLEEAWSVQAWREVATLADVVVCVQSLLKYVTDEGLYADFRRVPLFEGEWWSLPDRGMHLAAVGLGRAGVEWWNREWLVRRLSRVPAGTSVLG